MADPTILESFSWECQDLNSISYWFPILELAIPECIPKTEIIHSPNLLALLDGKMPEGWEGFINQLRAVGERVGYPCFLRTGHTSGKHFWQRTCCVTGPDQIGAHVSELVEFSEGCSLVGLPHNIWAVREWLRGPVIGVAPAYGNMPVRREFRIFIRDGKVQCGHPYWPIEALLQGGCSEETIAQVESMNVFGADREEVLALVLLVAAAFPGYWSVDCLWTDRGWMVTDMARGQDSWHWPECKFTL